MDLKERLDKVFDLDPSAIAIEQDERSWSYGQVHEFIKELDHLLKSEGHGEATAVGVLLRNRPACFAAGLGVFWTGRCLVTVNPLLPPAPLKKDLETLKAPVLIAEREDWDNPIFADAAKAAGSLGLAISADENGLYLEKVLSARPDTEMRPPAPGIAIEMLTSGTTGAPKRIKLEMANFSVALWGGSKYESGDGEVTLKNSPSLVWMPLVHISGLWNATYQLYNGRRVALLERFSIDKWHEAIKRYRLRFVTLPPSMLGEVLDRNFPKQDFESLLALRCGTAPLNYEHAAAFEARYGVPVLEAYGATEFAGGVAGWTIKDHKKYIQTKRTSVGRANRGIELRVVDVETFEPLPSDKEGLLEVKSKQIGDGENWMRTTDRVRIDEDGFLYILGRADNAINRGGFKVMPEAVETALRAHPSIKDVCVVGLKDERLGQVPVAVYELKNGANEPDTAAWKEFLSAQLKPYEIPAQYKAVESLPRTPSHKVSQLGVRELFSA